MSWIEDLLSKINERSIPITYHPHFIMRENTRNLSLRYVEMTVRSGRINKRKCEAPRKLCFERYFGKERITYVVIVIVHHYFWEVITCWKRKGR